jgi:hypothetical protein
MLFPSGSAVFDPSKHVVPIRAAAIHGVDFLGRAWSFQPRGTEPPIDTSGMAAGPVGATYTSAIAMPGSQAHDQLSKEEQALGGLIAGMFNGGLVGGTGFTEAFQPASGGMTTRVSNYAGPEMSAGVPYNLFIGQGPYQSVGQFTGSDQFSRNLTQVATQNAISRGGNPPSWYVGR